MNNTKQTIKNKTKLASFFLELRSQNCDKQRAMNALNQASFIFLELKSQNCD